MRGKIEYLKILLGVVLFLLSIKEVIENPIAYLMVAGLILVSLWTGALFGHPLAAAISLITTLIVVAVYTVVTMDFVPFAMFEIEHNVSILLSDWAAEKFSGGKNDE